MGRRESGGVYPVLRFTPGYPAVGIGGGWVLRREGLGGGVGRGIAGGLVAGDGSNVPPGETWIADDWNDTGHLG